MKIDPIRVINVYYKSYEKIFIGKLITNNRKIIFEYDPDFLKKKIELSPFKLPLKSGLIVNDDLTFRGLFGVFNDSLPDGWGRLLLERALSKHNLNIGSLSVLDRLSIVGSSGIGALLYEPVTENFSRNINNNTNLDDISFMIKNFLNNDEQNVEELFFNCGNLSGARPKILFNYEKNQWIIKFPSSDDPEDIGAIEYSYNLMAQEAGIEIPSPKLFPAKNGSGFFGCKRFDIIDNSRVHMHSVCGLSHADHRIPSIDYEMILRCTMFLTRNMKECVKLYRQCVFNVLTHNRDDHSKNFSFLMDHEGDWRLSPAYDLTFSSGPSNEHCSTIMGEGKNPGLSHLLELARISIINQKEAMNIIDEVKYSVSKWSYFAKNSGVTTKNIEKIKSCINIISKENF